MKRVLVVAVALAILVLPAAVGGQGSYPPGTVWRSPFVVQNMGDSQATVYVDYYRMSDGAHIASATETFDLEPGRARAVRPYLNPDPALTDGQYSVVISGTRPLAAIVNELATGREMAYNALHPGSQKVFLPNITKQYYGFSTPFYIQNSGEVDAIVTIEFYDFNTGIRIDSATRLVSLTPNASYEYDPMVVANSELPTNKQYAVVATAGAGQSIVAAVNQIGPDTDLAYSSFPSGGPDIYLPNMVKGYAGYITPEVIQNVGTTTAYVNVEYYGFDGTPYPLAGKKNYELQPGRSLPERPWTYPDNVLPNNKQYSVVVHGLDGDELVAIVNQNRSLADHKDGSAYNGFNEGTQFVFLPNTVKGYYGYITPIVIQNVGDATATITVRYYDFTTGTEWPDAGIKTYALAPGRSVAERPWTYSDAVLAPNAQYSVVVEGAPGDLLVAIVNQVKLDSALDNSSAYEGFGRTP
jgi:hypothetical protein